MPGGKRSGVQAPAQRGLPAQGQAEAALLFALLLEQAARTLQPILGKSD